jgi:hypothetical protein
MAQMPLIFATHDAPVFSMTQSVGEFNPWTGAMSAPASRFGRHDTRLSQKSLRKLSERKPLTLVRQFGVGRSM